MPDPFKLIWLSSFGAAGWDARDYATYDWRRPTVYGEMAKLLENRGGFDALVMEDQPFVPTDPVSTAVDIEFGGRSLTNDPMPLLSAVSWYTRHLGLVTTAATATWPPFMLARALGTFDHMSYGRAGWNVDTTFASALRANYTGDWGEADRYRRSEEFLAVCRMLWDSWEADAVLLDRVQGRFADGSKVHETGFEGDFFNVRGPMTFARPPQRYPVIASTDTTTEGLAFAGRNADLVVVKATSDSEAKRLADEVRAASLAAGRSAADIKVFWAVRPFVSDSDSDAAVLRARIMSTPAAVAIGADESDSVVIEGAPASVAGELTDLVSASGVDGMAIQGSVVPNNVLGITDRVVPLLRARGLVRTGYRHQGFRANLLDEDFVGISTDLVGGVK